MSNGNRATHSRYKVAKRETDRAYTGLLRGELDVNKLTMYDLPDDGVPEGANPRQQYPDWREDQVFTVTGPLGQPSVRKGRRFNSLLEAVTFYSEVQGADPVATLNGKNGVPSANQEEFDKELANRFYAIKFRLPRSEAMVQALREARNAV